ncbi:hypothetical protein DSM25558_5502 [Agrobacterium sp. DSM 25558]|uniref:BrnT family toxin n=1 Tax=Agrobacterium sp. DSM 25558 TaxID=1907665 RepID=UPI000972540B|nr:BrnT family toxin [Agrobacterium sp. DSM 25558]SCX32648.1 hypothetical protein DSM25558_5502 [Agrobacterium sp. DSM 25558]
MQFEWDDAKAQKNRVKHHVSFELAREVWSDPLHVIVPDRFEDGEQRWHALGMVGAVAILVVVHSYPAGEDDAVVRIIGARKATSHERRRYEQQQI